jgi:hypothetical protein
MRCPECNKFVSLDTEGDPEIELEADETTGEVTGTVRIVNACADCGAEMTEATFDVDVDFPEAAKHMAEHPDDEAHALDLEDPSADRTDRSEGKGRGTRTFYGAEAEFTVSCRCEFKETKPWSDDIQASHMDELN